LTRLPPPHRLATADALALLEANFLADVEVVALDAADYRGLLRRAPGSGLAGGAAYDAVVAACATRAGARILLTFNERHFASLAGSFAVVVPA
jgi:predicted nucleic acid-binding protein